MTTTTTALDTYLMWMRASAYAERTIEDRAATCSRIGRQFDCAPEELQPLQIMTFMANATWSAGTKATHHGELRAFFGWLVDQDLRADNPMRKVGQTRREARPVADEHMPILMAASMRRKTRVMILLAALAGLRVHEIAKLRGEDVDLVAGTLTVTGKGGVTTTLPLHPLLAEQARTMPRAGCGSRPTPGYQASM